MKFKMCTFPQNTAENLCQRHRQLQKEIEAYRSEIVRLEEVSQDMADTEFAMGTEMGERTEPETEEEDDLVVPKAVVSDHFDL